MDRERKNSVLIIDDEKANIIALTHILCQDYVIYAAKDGTEGLETVKEYSPDLILLDVFMPGIDGYEVLTRLKSNDETRHIPVIFVTGLRNAESEEKGFVLGAADYIIKPFSAPIVKLRVRNQIQIINQIDTIRTFSLTDQLTSISNRRNFDYRLTLEWEHAKRDKAPLSIFIVDIDNFKKYNDAHGHLQGDEALKTVAKVIEKSLGRSIDFASRWGGEEFAILLPGTDEQGAVSVAETVRKNIEDAPICHNGGQTTKITVSVGVNTHTPAKGDSEIEFVNRADNALYVAKKTGKNKVCLYGRDKENEKEKKGG